MRKSLTLFRGYILKLLMNGQASDGSGEPVPGRKKPDGRNKRTKEKSRNKSLIACCLCCFICYFKNG